MQMGILANCLFGWINLVSTFLAALQIIPLEWAVVLYWVGKVMFFNTWIGIVALFLFIVSTVCSFFGLFFLFPTEHARVGEENKHG